MTKEISMPYGSKFFPLREVSVVKRDAIEEDRCLIQYSRNLFNVLATTLNSIQRPPSSYTCTPGHIYSLLLRSNLSLHPTPQ